jgi:hypothetical protein
MRAKPLPAIYYLRELLKYDPNTGVFTWRTNEKVSKSRRGKVAGTLHHSGYIEILVNRTIYQAHRIAWLMAERTDPGDLQIDHINGIRDDNRRENLRLVTHSENQHNQRRAKGYYFYKQLNKWRAKIKLNGKEHHLGYYQTESEARDAYIQAKAKFHPTSPITK